MENELPTIVLLSGSFQPRGSSRYTLRLAQHLHTQGVSPIIFCPNAENLSQDRRQGIDVREYPQLRSLVLSGLARHWLFNDIRILNPQLLHIQSRRVQKLGTWLANHLEIPYILTVHDYVPRGEKFPVNWDLCKGIIAVSESVKRDLCTNRKIPANRVTVIRSGVDLTPCEEIRPLLDPDRIPVVGTACPLEMSKGLPYFLGAAAKVLSTGHDVEFLIAGAGPEESNLRRLSRELGISSRVTFVPYLLDFAPSLQAMDIFVLPSLQQGLGTIMLEAMALGRPVIATRVGGAYSVVHDHTTGLLVPPSNSGELADRMVELLGDPSKARTIGQAAREMVATEYSLDGMISRTAELYRDALSLPLHEETASKLADSHAPSVP